MSYANGFVPASDLAPLDGQPGCFLRADAAAAWNAARAEVKRRTGIVLTVRGWNRTYAEQVKFYLQRHRLAKAGERVCCYWQGRPYKFTGTAHAAPPGTSNHGWGLAVDVNDFGNVGNFSNPRRLKAFPILAEYGWTDTEGRGAIREPWHLVWSPSSAYAVNNPVGAVGSVSKPAIPEAPEALKKLPIDVQEGAMFRIHVTQSPDPKSGEVGRVYLVAFGPAGQELFQHIGPTENGIHQKAGVPIFAVSHFEKDTIRQTVINRAANWKVS